MEREVRDLGSEAGEPVCRMKDGCSRWIGERSYADEAQRARKFWVRGRAREVSFLFFL